jgi:hypothetical protein
MELSLALNLIPYGKIYKGAGKSLDPRGIRRFKGGSAER